jgi:hypothetical protein
MNPLACQEADAFIPWFGRALDLGRRLRNENNYETLLIANEYEHFLITEVFRRLAECMRKTAHKGLSHAARAGTDRIRTGGYERGMGAPAGR